MKIYVLFKRDNLEIINSKRQVIANEVKEIAQSIMGFDEAVMVYLHQARPLDTDIKIIIDTPPQNRANRIGILNSFKLTIHNLIKRNDPSFADSTVSAVIDTNFKPFLEPAPDYPQKRNISASDKNASQNDVTSEIDYEQRAKMYIPTAPDYTFDRVILPDKVLNNIFNSLNIIECEKKVFEEWGLKAIQPHPVSALSFFGPSGTGKTMAAEAIADKLGKKILKVSYADIESKYHGEGPKQVKAIFLAAEQNDAVLFIDEADSLLSKRLTNVTDGSGQAINSMRSQLLICLEQFKGIVIFATNLVVNYDQAFRTRLKSVEFLLPDKECREKIWKVHILPVNNNGVNLPLADDIDISALAEKYEFCGREIRKAVISACVDVAMRNQELITQNDLLNACETIIEEEKSLKNASDHTIKYTDKEKEIIKEGIKAKIKESQDA